MRTCVICRTKRPKDTLQRVARTPAGPIVLDERGTADGRGAYLCIDGPCRAAAASDGSALAHALRTRIPAGLLSGDSTETTDRTKMIPGGSHGT